ncbi:recombinase family protein [Rubinisphaera italica]|uniref:recombinase family protein n=1 Tax=Rubinisphaera italica TaxID=2527969 RepID=UPI0011B73FB1|nr:recombinase family protein [Rubinisphaera italica]
MTKRFVALARVSSREQEREGFSLEVQEEALERYAEIQDGKIVRLFRIAETATKSEERRSFKTLLDYCKKNAAKLDALLFFKVDRAARNLFDYVELERLEADYGLPVEYITQQTENTPAGRMMRRTLANMASFYTEQQSIDVKDGLHRRVRSGLFVGKAPYGYVNVRREGRSLVDIDEEKAKRVRRIFELYAFHGHTLDSLVDQLDEEGIPYTASQRRFARSKLHNILRDRAYIGELKYHDEWYPGTHRPIVDRGTFDRVQVLMGEQTYQSHELLYAGELITCGHCGRPITGEVKQKKTKRGTSTYRYYRCARYTKGDHPRIRIREEKIEEQVLAMFEQLKVQDEKVRRWFANALRARSKDQQSQATEKVEDLQEQITRLNKQLDQLLNLRLLEEIDESTFASKHRELRDRISSMTLKVEAMNRSKSEKADVAVKAFELSQTLSEKWVNADTRAKRQILEILCLNFSLDDVTLVPEWRKPFDVLAEGLDSENSRDDKI